eukprot:7125508-Pyramimonas_sp.AAC.2
MHSVCTHHAYVRVLSPQKTRSRGRDYPSHLRTEWESPSRIANVKLPVGANLRRVTEEEFTMVLPKLDFFDVWLQPSAQSWVT